MGIPLRVLMIEDTEDDALLVLHELRRGGYDVTWERVDSREAMAAALDHKPWDLIISDFMMPGFGAPGALELYKERGLDLPFIIASGTINEEQAVSSMRAGAHDFVTKSRLTRLLTAVERELREAEERRARRFAEQERRVAIEKYQALVEHMPALTYLASAQKGGGTLYVSPQIDAMTGFAAKEWVTDPQLWSKQIHPDDRERVLAELASCMESGDRFLSVYRLLTRDGRTVWWRDEARVVSDGEGSRIVHGFITEVTEQKRLESQLLQSQKMEAIGQLAGGVAHDFNNLLSVIIAYSDMLLGEVGAQDPRSRRVVQIRKAADRAAALTRQLLAFSRKQVLQPRILDLNAILADAEKLLHRLIGENIDLVTVPSLDLGRVKADPGQIEQVIMNLAVNSRDAMPKGGWLIVETANVDLDDTYAREHAGARPGHYVLLTVTDTGTGMDRETLAHIFEPFFTTKELGKGTGLGLSTVYGIVKQSGGYVWVDSEPGGGTTFKIYLPRTEEAAEATSRTSATAGGFHGVETLLLVEDNEAVRDVFKEVLESRGYKVLAAAGPEDALRLTEGHGGPINLLVTDLMMPGMTGHDLAGRLRAVRPEIKILFVSGYPGGPGGEQTRLQPGESFLQKPFTSQVFITKVREILDASLAAA